MNIVKYIVSREQGRKTADDVPFIARPLLIRGFVCSYDKYIMQEHIQNSDVIKVYITLINVTDSVNHEVIYMAWETRNIISDLTVFNKASTLVDINYEIRLELELQMSIIRGYFEDMSDITFLFIVNENDHCIKTNIAQKDFKFYFLSNKDKLLELKKQHEQFNFANNIKTMLKDRLQIMEASNIASSHRNIVLEWDMEVKIKKELIKDLEDELKTCLSEILA